MTTVKLLREGFAIVTPLIEPAAAEKWLGEATLSVYTAHKPQGATPPERRDYAEGTTAWLTLHS